MLAHLAVDQANLGLFIEARDAALTHILRPRRRYTSDAGKRRADVIFGEKSFAARSATVEAAIPALRLTSEKQHRDTHWIRRLDPPKTRLSVSRDTP